ncbi:MAG: glycogen phosphorylase [Acidobacteria bacterium RIFCSPLOWO2_02_FULL_60_20]|nr:MAG: glycogen phosphorylase [Acidobacteria bacterium RIFCSPLOWO2_02_FULL_60_20]
MNGRAIAAVDAVFEIEESIRRHAKYSLGKSWRDLSQYDKFRAVALAVRDRMMDRMLATEQRYRQADPKRLYYLSIEFLIGQSLGNNLCNLGIRDSCRQALSNLGADLEEIEGSEPDAALGNGGLGRLAACFLDSLATLGMPGYGYGINYEYGLFKQEIDNGYQREKPDNWLAPGTPWQIARPDEACMVPMYGRIEHGVDRHGGYNPMWMDWKLLIGVPYDMLIAGYGGRAVHFLRLYSARSSHDFDMQIFNDGDYLKAVEQKIASETITKVLYPSDAVIAGQELRLAQEYFLVACAVRDIVRRFEQNHSTFREFSSKVAIQINDTHPALTVAELMRILVDEKNLSWEQAWKITQETLAYTNHTLLPEALEKWPVPLLEHVLPRHLQIIYEINRRFLEQVEAISDGDNARLARMSLIEESTPKQVRMANLAIVGSHSINGVSRIHTESIKTSLAPEFFRFWPERFNNKTNGITQRRWLLKVNPRLADLISSEIGTGWITDLYQLRALENLAADAGFQAELDRVKRENKENLARIIHDSLRIKADPDSLFDVQVKRIHAYKRQLLNVMHIIDEYLSLIEDRKLPTVPRTYVFAGKAAPGYWLAKQIIKLICNVGSVINHDTRASEWMKVAFIPDYRVSLAEKILPAADLSEQISTAGTEASGTGNMKLALNGAVTIGTLDGANIEILEEVGKENMFVFGLPAAEVRSIREQKSYRPWEHYARNPHLKRVVDSFSSNLFCPHEPDLFAWIFSSVLDANDEHFHLADFTPYIEAQEKAGNTFRERGRWIRMAILNVARMGKFSSDRTVTEYAREIWGVKGSTPPD